MHKFPSFSIVFLLFLPACDWFSTGLQDDRHIQETVSMQHVISPTATIYISNIDGHTTVTGTHDNKISIKAIKSGLSDDVEELKIETDFARDLVKITTRDNRQRQILGYNVPFSGIDTRARIDYMIKVPEENRLYLKTARGDTRIDGMHGAVSLKTDRGNVWIDHTDGEVNVSIGRGDFTIKEIINNVTAVVSKGDIKAAVALMPRRRGPFLSLEAVKGVIDLSLPNDPHAFVTATSFKGKINSDFPLHIQKVRGLRKKSIRGVLGKGGPEIILRNKRGSINILKKS